MADPKLKTELEDGRDALTAEHGPWVGHNLHLGQGVHTMEPGLSGSAERRVERVTQIVSDHHKLDGLRVLDLGCHEGAFAIAIAQRGAEVLAIDAREAHVAKATFARDALGLERLTIRQGDVRELRDVGSFDVVLCLGILYHLEAAAAPPFLRTLASLAPMSIIETQVGLSRGQRLKHSGHVYRGFSYAEDTTKPGASVKNAESFWPTKPSLVNLLVDGGFTTVSECLAPAVSELVALRDHVLLVATSGERVSNSARLSERVFPRARPYQGRRYALLERLSPRLPKIFGKSRRRP